ncbi:MAG: hypothetical protein FJ387_22255 [Verrucomicrobia bacterium]|nr:hypothetical protein [Verrucomicrobiota bacterium]
MKSLVLALGFLLLGVGGALSGEPGNQETFYLQLVRGTDDDTPPVPHATRVGSKLSRRLQPVLRWKHYWELKQLAVSVRIGGKVRREMSEEREVEIELLNAERMVVRLYRAGNLTRVERQPVKTPMLIMGGDREDKDESWFIVVRQDKPGND